MRIFRRCMVFTFALIMMGLIFVPTANAADNNMIPKPTLKILVRGMDTGDYTLDLLVTDEKLSINQLISDKHIIAIQELYYYEDEEGYHPALLGGTYNKLYGEMKGFWQGDGTYEHDFWHTGVPKDFKIAIVTVDGNLIISELVHRKQYHSVMYFDVSDMSVVEKVNLDAGEVTEVLPVVSIIMSFLLRILVSLLIMIGIAKAMGIRSKQSNKVILTTKTITQSLINIVFIFQLFWGMQRIVNIFLFAQLAAVIIEAIVFAKLLEECKPMKRVTYALTANVVVTVVGYYLIYLLAWIAF